MTISAIILTYNEEKHIRRCIESLRPFVDQVYIMDSYSTDNTLDILGEYHFIQIKQQKFVNHATQFNTALRVFNITTDWVIRIDADEYIDKKLANWISSNLGSLDSATTGVYVNRYMTFMGRLLEYGGMSSYWMLRIWRNGVGQCEQRWMDEHIVLSHGNTAKAEGRLIDDNLNTLSWWSHKHVDYSTREAIDVLLKDKSDYSQIKPSFFGVKAERTRYLKQKYNRLPLFIRPFFYFIHRYFFQLGLRDGKEGFLWCILQGFWYRTMVDAKVYELKKTAINEQKSLAEVVKEKYGYEI
ncbi:TPA: glycosyltransferase family 2 protein [Vibrio cholerae]